MRRALILLSMVLFANGAAAQAMYRYVDPAGNTVLSDRPPPAGTPYSTIHPPGPPRLPSATPESGAPAPPPLPTVRQPAAQAPGTIPQADVPVDASATRDRGAFVPQGEAARDHRDMRLDVPSGEAARDVRDRQRDVPAGEAARERRDMQLNVPADEAARERRDVQLNVPSGEAAAERRDLQVGVPSGEQRTDEDAVKRNQ